MGPHKNSISLHKDEWKRLKSAGAVALHKPNNRPEQSEYIRSLIGTSQDLIKNWPENTQRHILNTKKEKEKELLKDIAKIRKLQEEHRIANKNEYILKAKQMIFEDSCYGRQLISALLESKTLEERVIQIEFQKKLTEIAKEAEKIQNTLASSLNFDTEQTEKELLRCNQAIAKNTAATNKAMYVANNEKKKQEKEKEIQDEIEDMELLKILISKENEEEEKRKLLLKEDLAQCIFDRQTVDARREKIKEIEERINKRWNDYENKKKFKTAMMYKERFSAPQYTKTYELINNLQNEERSRYEEFVNKGVMKQKNRELMQEREETLNRNNRVKNTQTCMQSNKEISEIQRETESNEGKNQCDRQCIIAKCKDSHKIKTFHRDPPTFTSISNNLVENLRKREKERTPWTALAGQHEHFARQASETLQQCKYKNTARKVVDDYRKVNGLNPQTLPIANYF